MTATGVAERLLPDEELVVALVSKAEISAINRRFLGHEGATDVISFDYRDAAVDQEAEGMGGAELVVCLEVAAEEAAARGVSPASELVLYIVHGLLHLAGLEDGTAPERQRMRQREQEIMNQLGREFQLDAVFTPTPRRRVPGQRGG